LEFAALMNLSTFVSFFGVGVAVLPAFFVAAAAASFFSFSFCAFSSAFCRSSSAFEIFAPSL
jgi:hypothetical protein